jgi:hypothetical protein
MIKLFWIGATLAVIGACSTGKRVRRLPWQNRLVLSVAVLLGYLAWAIYTIQALIEWINK